MKHSCVNRNVIMSLVKGVVISALVFLAACGDDGNSSAAGDSSSVKGSCESCEYGSLKDKRDGKTYKTVKIGNQWWMAENLNYADSAKTPSLKGNTRCFRNEEDKCKKYGRLYTWAAAIDSVTLATDSENPLDCGYQKRCKLPGGLQGICPDGWHLPSKAEWTTLIYSLGGESKAARVLKSKTGWMDNNGNDSVGFSALPAGSWQGKDHFDGNEANFWSATEYYNDLSFSVFIYYYYDVAELIHGEKQNGFSIRCIKDDFVRSSSSAKAPKSSSSSVEKSSSSSVTKTESSSSVTPKSSSSMRSSSSEAVIEPCKTCELDSLVDDRDNQSYKTVKIGEQWWMAENLNYETDGSFCYNKVDSNCVKYGRLYKWMVAKDTLCPSGWHLPDTTEWNTLFSTVGGTATAGKMLKSTSGWSAYDGKSGNGVDAYFFTAISAGFMNFNGFSYMAGRDAKFWTSEEETEYGNAYDVYLSGPFNEVSFGFDPKNDAYSVRCLKD